MNIIRNIEIQGAEGRPTLLDLYVERNGEQKPVVIFSHGFKGFKDYGCWDLVARTFAGAGFVFIKYNFSHNGTTVDEPLEFADLEAFGHNNYCKELDDLGYVIDWVVNGDVGVPINELRRSEIYLIGHSRAGGITLLKALEDTRVRKIATWASVASLDRGWENPDALAHWKETGVHYIANSRTKQQMPLYFQLYKNFQANKERLDVSAAIKQLEIPGLIVHGTADPTVPFSDAEKIVKQNPKHFKVFSVESADHVFGGSHPWTEDKLPVDLKKVVEGCIDFFRESV